MRLIFGEILVSMQYPKILLLHNQFYCGYCFEHLGTRLNIDQGHQINQISAFFFLQEIKEAAERLVGLWPNVEINSFEFEGYDVADRYVKIVPESQQYAGWKVESIKRPAVVCM